jgi:hypothetical protein
VSTKLAYEVVLIIDSRQEKARARHRVLAVRIRDAT